MGVEWRSTRKVKDSIAQGPFLPHEREHSQYLRSRRDISLMHLQMCVRLVFGDLLDEAVHSLRGALVLHLGE